MKDVVRNRTHPSVEILGFTRASSTPRYRLEAPPTHSSTSKLFPTCILNYISWFNKNTKAKYELRLNSPIDTLCNTSCFAKLFRCKNQYSCKRRGRLDHPPESAERSKVASSLALKTRGPRFEFRFWQKISLQILIERATFKSIIIK